MTDTQIQKAAEYYSELIKETVTVDVISGTMYVFGSELACLRLNYIYKTANGTVAYSTNLKTWYFSRSTTL